MIKIIIDIGISITVLVILYKLWRLPEDKKDNLW